MRETLNVCIEGDICGERVEEIFLPADGSIVEFPFNPSYETAMYGTLRTATGAESWGRLIGEKLSAQYAMESGRIVTLYKSPGLFRIE